MPSVTDVQQQQSILTTNNNGKSTPPPTQQATSMDPNSTDPIIQMLIVLEKKQRNLGKRKEKLEGYQQEATSGKELIKDQKDALAKYPEVLGQIECARDISEQLKKIQTETSKNQKRLSKQAAEEKRVLVAQRTREYAQIRHLLDHRPTSLKSEESALLDALSAVIIPSDNSLNSISRSVDTVLAIYQGGSSSSTIKTLTGKNPQEVREILEELVKNFDTQQISSSTSTVLPPEPEQVQEKELDETNDIQSSSKNLNEYPLQFDTRDQNIPLEQMIQDSLFFSNDLNNQMQDNNRDQSPDPKQYLPTITVLNSNINDQSSSSIENQQQDNLTNAVSSNEDQQSGEQWHHRRGNGSAYRGGTYNNEAGNRNYNRGGPNNYNQQQRRGRGSGWYNNSYGGNQRPYNENNRGRGGPNPNYRGNRGGNYRGNNRGYNNNGDGYQKSAQYQQNNDQYQQDRSAPPSQP